MPNTLGPMDEVEKALFPTLTYEQMTLEQREHVIRATKQLVFARTGRCIP